MMSHEIAPASSKPGQPPQPGQLGVKKLKVHPTSRSVSIDLHEDGQRLETGDHASVEVKLLPKLNARVRVHESTLESLLDHAARDIESKPVARAEHYTLWLKDVRLRPVVNGISIDCDFEAELHVDLTSALKLEPHVRGHASVATAPLFVEAGRVYLRVQNVDMQPAEDYGRVVSAGFKWVKEKLHLQEHMQHAMQNALDDELNGKSLLELATAGRASGPPAAGEPTASAAAPPIKGKAASGADSRGGEIGPAAAAPHIHQTADEEAAAEQTVGKQPSHAEDAEALERYGPPPTLKKALQFVDITSARGAIMTSEQGDLCLEVQFGPTAKTKRTLRNVAILGGVLLALLLIIIISVVVAKHRS